MDVCMYLHMYVCIQTYTLYIYIYMFLTTWGLRSRKADRANKENHYQTPRAGVDEKKIKIEEENRKSDGDKSQHSEPVPPEVASALKQVHLQNRTTLH